MLKWLQSETIAFPERKYHNPPNTQSSSCSRPLLLRTGLDSGLGDLATGLVSLDNGLDDTNSDSLAHVTDSEAAERRVIGESLNTHWLGWHHLDDGSIARLDELGVVLDGLSGTAVDLLEDLGELACDVGGMAV